MVSELPKIEQIAAIGYYRCLGETFRVLEISARMKSASGEPLVLILLDRPVIEDDFSSSTICIPEGNIDWIE